MAFMIPGCFRLASRQGPTISPSIRHYPLTYLYRKPVFDPNPGRTNSRGIIPDSFSKRPLFHHHPRRTQQVTASASNQPRKLSQISSKLPQISPNQTLEHDENNQHQYLHQHQQRQPTPQSPSTAPSTKAKPSQSDRLIIIGLGNPGLKYAQTRHNVGFMIIDSLASHLNVTLHQKPEFHSQIGETTICSRKLYLLKPTTSMNESGQALKNVMKYYNIGVDGVMVIVDDMALELGRMRLRGNGSAGGHNGLKSVEKYVGGKEYCRLRIGVGEAKGGSKYWKGHVLGKFNKREWDVLKKVVVLDALDVLDGWIQHGDLVNALNVLSRLQNRS